MNIPNSNLKRTGGRKSGKFGRYDASKILKNYKPENKTLTFGELLAETERELKETRNILRALTNGTK